METKILVTTVRRHSNYAFVLAGLLVAVLAIFIADTITDYAVAVAIFHTAVMLIATRFLKAGTVAALAGAAILLTCVSFMLTSSGDYAIGLVNTGISVVAIGVTTYLGLRLKRAEAQVHETRERLTRIARLTTLGQLTASIAHEVSQPLAAIAASAGAARRWLAQAEPNSVRAMMALERIAWDANRTSDILDRVRRLARNEAPAAEAFDLNAAVLEIIDLSSSTASASGVELTSTMATSLPAAFADRVQVQQVISNLILNGLEAVTVPPRREPRLLVTTALAESRLLVSVTDNGHGLSSDAVSQLFDAFWTTKAGGIGLGLTICRSIIEANDGQIWCDSPTSGGCRFTFDLPIAAEVA